MQKVTARLTKVARNADNSWECLKVLFMMFLQGKNIASREFVQIDTNWNL